MPINKAYHLPLMASTGQVQHSSIQTGFELVKTFSSREGVVELAKSKRSCNKLRIIKSVRHSDKNSPPSEARNLANLPAIHPNVVRLFACELNATGYSLMLFEYCSGGDLFSQSKHRELTSLLALHVVISVSEALAFIHHSLVYNEDDRKYERVSKREGTCHQDVKDDNVFLRFPGSTGGGLPDVVLADFGLSNPVFKTIPGNGCVTFMSPECKLGSGRLTHKTDVYSFGVMCLGLFDLHSKGFWPMHKNPKHVKVSKPYKGFGLTDMIQKCLAVKVADRGDFSGTTGSGMLSKVLDYREKRRVRLRNGEKIDKSYWVAKI